MTKEPMDTFRRTGRTTRQLAALVEQLQPGKTCVYVNPSSIHVSYVLNLLCDVFGCKAVPGQRNTVRTPSGAIIKSTTPEATRHSSPRAVVAYDHYISESGMLSRMPLHDFGREEFKPQ